MRQHYPLDPATGIGNAALAWANGNPATGQNGSYPPFGLFVDPQAEIIAAQRSAGLADSGDGSDTAQLSQAMSRGTWLGTLGQPVTVNDLSAALPGSILWPKLLIGMEFSGVISAANIGPMTVTLTGFGTLPGKLALVARSGAPLAAGDLSANAPFKFRFDGTQFRVSSPVATDTNLIINNYLRSQPPVQQVFVDPIGGSESNDGKSTATARSNLDNVLDEQSNVGTGIILLNNAALRRRHNIYGSLTIYGAQPISTGKGWIDATRLITFTGTADNSPLADGTTFCSGLWLLGANLVTNSIVWNLPAQAGGQNYNDHIRSDYGTGVLILGSNLTISDPSAGFLLGATTLPFNSFLAIGLPAGTTGHLFRGVSAGANPNTLFQYRTNITSA